MNLSLKFHGKGILIKLKTWLSLIVTLKINIIWYLVTNFLKFEIKLQKTLTKHQQNKFILSTLQSTEMKTPEKINLTRQMCRMQKTKTTEKIN